MKKNIEGRVADTLLQQPEKVAIGDREYDVAPPSIATLVMASKYISQLPQVRLEKENVLGEVLSVAKDCAVIGDILAVLILGARHCQETVAERTTRPKRGLPGLFGFTETVVVERVVDRKSELATEIMEVLQPREAYAICARLIQNLQIADFFGLTTFLIEINLLNRTRKVEETTASGQSSPA